jgi:hypothetical protein
MCYGSEIWILFDTKRIAEKGILDRLLYCENTPYEKIHVRFCKHILVVHTSNVSKNAINLAVSGELGSPPIALYFITNNAKHFFVEC